MATRFGQNTWWNFYPEATFGTTPTTASAVPFMWNLTLNMKTIAAPIDRPVKSGVITPTACDQIYGYSLVLVSMDGACTATAIAALKPSYLQSVGTGIDYTPKSFSIIEYDTVQTGSCRIAKGATVKSLNLSYTVKDSVKLNATFMAKNILSWRPRPAMTGSGAHYSKLICNLPLLNVGFSTADFGINNVSRRISSFDLSLDTLFVQDDVKYGGSGITPVSNLAVFKTGTLTFTTMFDTADTALSAYQFDGLQGALLTAPIYITLGDNQQIILNGIVSNVLQADPDKGIWMHTILITLKKTSLGDMIQIALI